MPDLLDLLSAAARDLKGCHARFALVGGLAVSARSRERFTADVDFAIAVANDHDAEQIVHAIAALGYDIDMPLEHLEAQRLAAVRLKSKLDHAVYIDFIFASSGIEHEIVAQATELKVARTITIPTARVPHLIAMKVLSVSDARPNDAADLQALLAVADQDDLALARSLLDKITQRGFSAGQDLHAKLDGFIERFGAN